MTDGIATEYRAPLERETKLTPPAGFELSALDPMVLGGSVRSMPSLDLVATYFDTHALTLARSGITIRHRTGDGPPTWTLKLPAGNRADGMVRRELDIEGERSRRPPELTAIVAAHLRGRRLVPVADLHSLRDRVVIVDEHGTDLVEVAHDVVTATDGRRSLGAWEEVEVELRDPIRGAEVRRDVARALRAAGCTMAPAVPKLVRALGDAATAAPEAVVPDLPHHPSVTEVVRHALARSVAQILAHDPAVRLGGDPEDLHQLRVNTRRLRSNLRTFREVLDADAAEQVRAELRWVADETNQLRDLDVLGAWLQERSSVVPVEDHHEVDALIQHFEDLAAIRRAELVRLLESRRYSELIDDLVHLTQATPDLGKKAERRARKRLARQVHRRWQRLEAEMQGLGKVPRDADLHRARIAAKKCRAAADAVEPLAGRDMHRFARSLAQLQDVLGAVHDASVFESLLRQAGKPPAAFAAGQLAVLARIDGQADKARWPHVWKKVQRRHDAV